MKKYCPGFRFVSQNSKNTEGQLRSEPLKFLSPRISHALRMCAVTPASQLLFVANKNTELAALPLQYRETHHICMILENVPRTSVSNRKKATTTTKSSTVSTLLVAEGK